MSFFHPIRPLLLGWLVSLAGWGAVALVLGAQFVMNTGEPWEEAAMAGARDWLPWAILTPLLFRFAARLPLDRQHWKFALPAHLVCGVVTVMGCFWWKTQGNPWRRMMSGPRMSFGVAGGAREAGAEWVGMMPGAPMPPREMRGPDRPRPGDRESPPPPREFSWVIRSERGFEERGFGERGPRPPGPFPGRHGSVRIGFISALHLATLELPIYLMIMSAAHATLFYRRSQERAASLARARLEALKMQLQPHFLFNTLNTIAGLVHEEPDKADAVLTALSDLLRFTLESSSQLELPLARELEFIERYLAILHARFENRLQFAFDIAPETRAALVPTFLLQPLVENAVRHGLEPKPAGGTVTIRAHREAGTLRLAVADNGVGAPDLAAIHEGIGLGNTRARLRELYGAAATLTLHNGNGLTVEIALPFRTAA